MSPCVRCVHQSQRAPVCVCVCVLSSGDYIPPLWLERAQQNVLSFIPFDMRRWDIRMLWKWKDTGRDGSKQKEIATEIGRRVQMYSSVSASLQTAHKQHFVAVRPNCIAFPSLFWLHFATEWAVRVCECACAAVECTLWADVRGLMKST